jgi:hypothetical protein
MKLINVLMLVAMISTSIAFAGPKPIITYTKSSTQYIEKNILANLRSDVLEIKSSTIQLIIELHNSNTNIDLDVTVIPLLDILKTSEEPELRIYSALALYYLQSELGKFAVSRRIEYDESDRVSRMCQRLTTHWDTVVDSESNYATTGATEY